MRIYLSEIYKLKCRWEFIVMLFTPLLVCLYICIARIENKLAVWQYYYNVDHSSALSYYLFSTISIITLVFLILVPPTGINVEHTKSNFNTYLTLPFSRIELYNAKVLAFLTYLTIYTLLWTGVYYLIFFIKDVVVIMAIPFIFMLISWYIIALLQILLRLLFKNYFVYLLITTLLVVAYIIGGNYLGKAVPYYFSQIGIITSLSFKDILIVLCYGLILYGAGFFKFKRLGYVGGK